MSTSPVNDLGSPATACDAAQVAIQMCAGANTTSCTYLSMLNDEQMVTSALYAPLYSAQVQGAIVRDLLTDANSAQSTLGALNIPYTTSWREVSRCPGLSRSTIDSQMHGSRPTPAFGSAEVGATWARVTDAVIPMSLDAIVDPFTALLFIIGLICVIIIGLVIDLGWRDEFAQKKARDRTQ